MYEHKRSRKILCASLVGNILEWYDFAVYGFFAATIAKQFFPADNATISLIAAFGAFAAGFLMRPIGAFIFGYIGDLWGRKRMLFLSIMLMSVPTFIIGILPTHAQIGIWAAVLMVIVRMLQGLSVGGEYTGSIVYMIEHSPKNKRGYYGSFSLAGAVIGILMGSGVGALINAMLTDAQVLDWGWRVPFLLGISIGLIGLLIRKGIPKTHSHEDKTQSPYVALVQHHKKPMFQTIGLNTMGAVCFYTLFVYMTTWLAQEAHQSKTIALQINTISLFVLLVCTPLFALISDKIGRKPILLFGSIAMCVAAFPIIRLMHSGDFVMIVTGQAIFAIILASFMSVIPAFMVESFPQKIRASATSVSYNIPYALFGGTAPMVAVWLIYVTKNPEALAFYLMIVSFAAFLVTFSVKETKDSELM